MLSKTRDGMPLKVSTKCAMLPLCRFQNHQTTPCNPFTPFGAGIGRGIPPLGLVKMMPCGAREWMMDARCCSVVPSPPPPPRELSLDMGYPWCLPSEMNFSQRNLGVARKKFYSSTTIAIEFA